MANDVTTLTLAVDTTDVKTASQTLGQMAQAGNTAAASTTRLQQANSAMVAELKRISAGVSELVKLASAERTAASAVEKRSKASAAAAVSSAKASAALRNEVKEIEKLAPAATISAGAMQKLSLSASNVSDAGVKELTKELSAAATQASRTAAAVNSISVKPQQSVQQSTSNQSSDAARAAREAERAASQAARDARAEQRAAERQAAEASKTARNDARISARNDLAAQKNQARDAAQASKQLADAQRQQAKEAGNAAFKNQQLGFQLHDFFVQVASGQSPLTAFIQQGSQLSGTFGGAGNAFRAVLGLLTPLRVAIGGAAGAVLGLGYAFVKANEDARELNKALILSGNFAGQTKDSFNSLAAGIANGTRANIGQAKDAVQTLIATGQIGPEVLAKAAEASALITKVTGQTAEDVAKDFAQMAQSPTKFARELNRTSNLFSAAQLQLIKGFEETQQPAKAQEVIISAIIGRMSEFNSTLSKTDKALDQNSKFWSALGNSIKGAFDSSSIDSEISRLEANVKRLDAIAAGRNQQQETRVFNPTSVDTNAGIATRQSARTQSIAAGNLEEARDALKRAQARKDANDIQAMLQAEIATRAKAGDAANEYIDSLVKEGKATSELKKENEKLDRAIKNAADAGTPRSKEDISVARRAIAKKFTDSEAGQVLKAQLDKDIKSIQDILEQERDAFSFNEKFLHGQYQAGQKSLKDYYDERKTNAQQGIDAEIAVLQKENERLEKFRKETKDPSEKVQTSTRIDENTAKISQLRAQGIREQELLNQEATASFKQLDESVSNYNATLEQLLGNEEKAASIRAAIAIQNAKVLSSQKGGTVIDVAAYEKALAIQNQFNEVQRRSQALTAAGRTAEEAFAEAAEQRGLSIKDTDTGIYQIRKLQLDQLAELVRKANELAAASTNPAVKQFAADLALEYAKAAKSIDPALQRLKDANKEIAQTIANTLTNLPKTFSDAFSRRRQQANDDIKNEKSEYDRRIDQLEEYLAESTDKQDKARLRERIKALQAEKAGVKKESRASSFLKTIGETILAPIGQQAIASFSKPLTDNLQKSIESSLNNITTGDSGIGKFFKDLFGVQSDPKQIAQDQQIIAINSTTTALQALEAAARAAAGALPSPGNPNANGASAEGDSNTSALPDSEIFGDFGQSVQDAESGNKELAKTIPTVTNVLSKLTGATSDATSALSILPSIISLITSSSSGSAASGIGGLFGSLFGGSSSSAGSGAISNELFHSGGIVGAGSGMRRTTSSNIFAGALKYHKGGIAGLAPDEVPAILMGGPKGRREEILTAKDPRHRDNLLNPQNRPYMAGQHSGSSTNNNITNRNQTINQEFHFNTGGAPVDRRSAQQVGAVAFRETARANKRYN